MTDKIKIKFLTAIWGARYIEEFARVSLPSYLAPDNLPYVAAETELEVLILTTTDSRAAARAGSSAAALMPVGKPRLAPIPHSTTRVTHACRTRAAMTAPTSAAALAAETRAPIVVEDCRASSRATGST